MSSKIKILLVTIIIVILGIIALGLFSFWFGDSSNPVGAGWYVFSFAAGLTMIVLPCTLPLAFVIVPLSMGKGPVKGLLIALCFGLGVAVMLSLYGVVTAVVGKGAIDGLKADIETVKNWMYLFAGAFAFAFALGEIGLVKFRMPTYTGAAPAFIQKQGDFFKAFFLGIFLGNIGIGCPHPATPVILTRIATSGDVFYGWMLFLVHAVGRVLPLLLLAILGILGVNALNWLVARKDKIERATGWGMVFVAGYILTLGLFTHDWWVNSGQHSLFESLTQEKALTGFIASKIGSGAPHAHGLETGTGLFGLPLHWGNWFLAFIWSLPLWWWYKKKKKEVAVMVEGEEKHIAVKDLSDKKWTFAILTILFAVVIVYTLPQRFYHMAMQGHHEEMSEEGQMMMDHGDSSSGGHGHSSSGYAYHESKDVTSGMAVDLTLSTQTVEVGKPVVFQFFVNNKPAGTPVVNLEIEHEKLMHVIGVRSDLNEFFHIHPVSLSSKQGAFAVEYAFKKPGKYKIWSEVKTGGVVHTFGLPEVIVVGAGPTEEKSVEFGTTKIVGDSKTGLYQVLLHYETPIQATKTAALHFEIHDQNGQEVEVDPYLGADMHLNIVKDDLGELIHTHPGGAGGSGDGHTDHSHTLNLVKTIYADAGHNHSTTASDHGIPFEVVISKPGTYRAFAQFRPKGSGLGPEEYLVAQYWLQVEEPKSFEFTGTTGKIILTLISLVLMFLLSKWIKKYLTVKA